MLRKNPWMERLPVPARSLERRQAVCRALFDARLSIGKTQTNSRCPVSCAVSALRAAHDSASVGSCRIRFKVSTTVWAAKHSGFVDDGLFVPTRAEELRCSGPSTQLIGLYCVRRAGTSGQGYLEKVGIVT